MQVAKLATKFSWFIFVTFGGLLSSQNSPTITEASRLLHH
jgi:hypothetical protein